MLAIATSLVSLLAATPASAQCQSAADCKGGRACKAGQCVDATCTKDTDCTGDNVCRAGTCAPPNAPTGAGPLVSPMPGPQPVRYEVVTRGIPWLYITGPIVLGTAYIAGIAVAAAVTGESDRGKVIGFMAVPVAGPWIVMSLPSTESSYNGALVAGGLMQASGLIMTILGLTIRQERRVPIYSLMTPEEGKPWILPGPVGATGYGLNLGYTSF